MLAVSKTFPAEAVLEAMAAGQRAFGENYLQEALDKIARRRAGATPVPAVEWHFIGPIQSNKTRPIAASFAWVHTVERLKIAQRLSEQRPPELAPLNICLQVNISGEASKSGASPAELPALAREVAQLPNLRLRGLMAIPEPDRPMSHNSAPPSPACARCSTRCAPTAWRSIRCRWACRPTWRAAIAEGATIVRVGSAIFGKRDYT